MKREYGVSLFAICDGIRHSDVQECPPARFVDVFSSDYFKLIRIKQDIGIQECTLSAAFLRV